MIRIFFFNLKLPESQAIYNLENSKISRYGLLVAPTDVNKSVNKSPLISSIESTFPSFLPSSFSLSK